MHEHLVDLVEIIEASATAFAQHVDHRVMGRVNVTARRVSAIEHGKILHLAVVARRLAKPGKRLTEVDRAVVRVAPAGSKIDLQQASLALDEHRDSPGALRRFTAASESVLSNIGADDDGLATRAIRGQVPKGCLQAVHPREAGLLELRDLAVARQLRAALCEKRVVDHALNDDRARGVVTAGLGAEGEHADALRIDGVILDEPQRGVRRQGIDALARAAHPETSPHNTAGFVPGLVIPATPVL